MQPVLRYFAAIISLLMLFSGFAACKKNPVSEGNPSLTPAVTAKGVPKGAGVQQVIGPAGGTLTSADGKLTVNVPAGAVTANATFGIQPITNTLMNDTTKRAFRLTPEGTVFAKPVEVIYHYAADAEGIRPELLMAGYQTEQGAWKAVPARVNTTTQQFSFQTTHFSDWMFNSAVELKASKQHVRVGEEVQLEVTGLVMLDDDLLAPLPSGDFRGWLEEFDWRLLNNFGALTYQANDPSKAEYEPNHPEPGGDNKAEISVTCKGNIKIKDDNAPGGYQTFKQLILLTSIDILGDVFMAGSFGDAFNMTQVTALMANGRIYVTGHSADVSVAFEIYGFQADGYPSGERGIIGNLFTHVSRTLGPQPYSYGSEYEACTPTRVQHYSSGVVNLKKWGAIGEPVEGSFSGTLYTNDGYDENRCPKYKERTLNATFKTVRSL